MMSLLMFLFFLIFVSYNLSYWFFFSLILFSLIMTMFMNINFYYSMISIFWGVDLMSLYFMVLTIWICSLMLISSVALYNFKNWNFFFSFLISLIILILVLVFSSLNMFMFYLFFEFSLIPVLILILGWGYQPERLQAGMYMLMYTFFASLPMMIMIFYLYKSEGSMMFNFMTKSFSFYMFILMSVVFLVKFPMFLFHLWLPKAHVEAPVSGSMILAGIMLKLGGYGLIRLLGVMGESLKLSSYFSLLILSLMGGLYISMICLRQYDMKSLIAYSSVAHMSLVISGSLIMSSMSIFGSLILMLSHGLCSSGLFCLSNIVYERTFSRSLFINKGLMVLMPNLSLWWFIFCSFNMAVPPSLNLLGELLLFMSLYSWSVYLLIPISLLSFFSACYSLFLFSFSQHGKSLNTLFWFWVVNLREHVLMFFHFFPMIYFLFIDF